MGIFWGRYGLPVPRRVDIIVLIGKARAGWGPRLLHVIVKHVQSVCLSAGEACVLDCGTGFAGVCYWLSRCSEMRSQGMLGQHRAILGMPQCICKKNKTLHVPCLQW